MANAPKSTPQAGRSTPKVDFVDRPELAETYADSIQSVTFDGQSLRINFCVTRLDDLKQDQTPSGKRYPTCRLVLSPGAALDLINQMQRISAALAKAGVLKPTEAPSPERKN